MKYKQRKKEEFTVVVVSDVAFCKIHPLTELMSEWFEHLFEGVEDLSLTSVLVERVHSVDEEMKHCLLDIVQNDIHSFDSIVNVVNPLDDDLVDTMDEQDNDASVDHQDKVHVLLENRNY